MNEEDQATDEAQHNQDESRQVRYGNLLNVTLYCLSDHNWSLLSHWSIAIICEL